MHPNQPTFQWKTDCFFCDEKVCFDSEHQERHPESRRVGGKEESVLLIDRIRKKCDEEMILLLQMLIMMANPSTNPFLFLVELSLFSTRAFSKLHIFLSL